MYAAYRRRCTDGITLIVCVECSHIWGACVRRPYSSVNTQATIVAFMMRGYRMLQKDRRSAIAATAGIFDVRICTRDGLFCTI